MRIIGKSNTRRVWVDGYELRPDHSQRLYSHSPDGFNWGYGGSGPAQLALAILLRAGVEDGLAMDRHQDLKREFVALLPEGDFDETIEVRQDGTWLWGKSETDGDRIRRRIAEVDAARSDGRVSI